MSESTVHFVKVSFVPVSEEEMELLLTEDERLNDLFSDPAIVEYDGFERGQQDFVMYFYGPDADQMASSILPELSHLPCKDRAVVLKRYGEPGEREVTVKLT